MANPLRGVGLWWYFTTTSNNLFYSPHGNGRQVLLNTTRTGASRLQGSPQPQTIPTQYRTVPSQSYTHAHWLLVQARIDYKLSTICHNFCSDSSAAYLYDLTVLPHMGILHIPCAKTKLFGQRSFSYCAQKQLNYIPSVMHAWCVTVRTTMLCLYVTFEVLCRPFCWPSEAQCAHPCQWDSAVEMTAIIINMLKIML